MTTSVITDPGRVEQKIHALVAVNRDMFRIDMQDISSMLRFGANATVVEVHGAPDVDCLLDILDSTTLSYREEEDGCCIFTAIEAPFGAFSFSDMDAVSHAISATGVHMAKMSVSLLSQSDSTSISMFTFIFHR